MLFNSVISSTLVTGTVHLGFSMGAGLGKSYFGKSYLGMHWYSISSKSKEADLNYLGN